MKSEKDNGNGKFWPSEIVIQYTLGRVKNHHIFMDDIKLLILEKVEFESIEKSKLMGTFGLSNGIGNIKI